MESTWTLTAAITATGAVVTWGLASWHKKWEVRKLKDESAKLVAERDKLKNEKIGQQWALAKDRQGLNEVYSEHMRTCNRHLEKLWEKIRNKAKAKILFEEREGFCRILLEHSIPAFMDYFEACFVEYRMLGHSEAYLTDMATSFALDMTQFATFISTINDSTLREFVGGAVPCRLQTRRFQAVENAINSLNQNDRIVAERIIRPSLKALMDVGCEIAD